MPDSILKYRLQALFFLLVSIEAVNLIKLSGAFGWTNHPPLGFVTAFALGAFLVGSIVASSFDLDPSIRRRLHLVAVMLFIVQTLLICIVSYLISQHRMPAEDVAVMFGTPTEATRRVVAVLEGLSINLAALAMWGVLASLWRAEADAGAKRRNNLASINERIAERRRSN